VGFWRLYFTSLTRSYCPAVTTFLMGCNEPSFFVNPAMYGGSP
jgi:hypothetical protein